VPPDSRGAREFSAPPIAAMIRLNFTVALTGTQQRRRILGWSKGTGQAGD
jgi:hypothetical protein